jgi:hypothetical protein
MLGEFRTGLIVAADGSKNPPRADRQGSLVVSQSHGRYTEAAFRGNLCFSYSAARATSVPATAMIGNIVWNPPGSGIVLALQKWTAQIQVTSATCLGISLAYGAQAITPTTVTAANSYGNTFLNAGSPGNCIAKAYSIATLLVVPTVVMNLYHNTAAIATTGVDIMQGDLEGMFIVPPGYIVCLASLGAAVAAAGMTSTLTWEEIPE